MHGSVLILNEMLTDYRKQAEKERKKERKKWKEM